MEEARARGHATGLCHGRRRHVKHRRVIIDAEEVVASHEPPARLKLHIEASLIIIMVPSAARRLCVRIYVDRQYVRELAGPALEARD